MEIDSTLSPFLIDKGWLCADNGTCFALSNEFVFTDTPDNFNDTGIDLIHFENFVLLFQESSVHNVNFTFSNESLPSQIEQVQQMLINGTLLQTYIFASNDMAAVVLFISMGCVINYMFLFSQLLNFPSFTIQDLKIWAKYGDFNNWIKNFFLNDKQEDNKNVSFKKLLFDKFLQLLIPTSSIIMLPTQHAIKSRIVLLFSTFFLIASLTFTLFRLEEETKDFIIWDSVHSWLMHEAIFDKNSSRVMAFICKVLIFINLFLVIQRIIDRSKIGLFDWKILKLNMSDRDLTEAKSGNNQGNLNLTLNNDITDAINKNDISIIKSNNNCSDNNNNNIVATTTTTATTPTITANAGNVDNMNKSNSRKFNESNILGGLGRPNLDEGLEYGVTAGDEFELITNGSFSINESLNITNINTITNNTNTNINANTSTNTNTNTNTNDNYLNDTNQFNIINPTLSSYILSDYESSIEQDIFQFQVETDYFELQHERKIQRQLKLWPQLLALTIIKIFFFCLVLFDLAINGVVHFSSSINSSYQLNYKNWLRSVRLFTTCTLYFLVVFVFFLYVLSVGMGFNSAMNRINWWCTLKRFLKRNYNSIFICFTLFLSGMFIDIYWMTRQKQDLRWVVPCHTTLTLLGVWLSYAIIEKVDHEKAVVESGGILGRDAQQYSHL
ncbi:hypothetical protein DAMA08_016080 [Martiniozyma asiatica (nom. inval.)]|nr:hypothetical protein DAMA08_016080 [Martiniozyma asiatica]